MSPTIDIFFRATPWAIPLTAFALVALILISRPVGRGLRTRPVLAWLYLSAIAGYLSVTTTPSSSAGYWSTSQTINFQVQLGAARDLFSLTADSLNVWVTVPLGVSAVLVSWAGRKWTPVATAPLLPLAAESLQFLLPELGRSAFFLTDVVANWVGLAMGAAVGWVICIAIVRLRPQAEALLRSSA